MLVKLFNKKRAIILLPLLYVALVVGISVVCSDSTFAAVSAWRKEACATPINSNTSRNYTIFMKVSSSLLDNSFDNLGGGSDQGVHWACYEEVSGNNFILSGIMFIASSISASGRVATYPGSSYAYPIYTIYSDVNISGSSGQTNAVLSGMVHYNGETTAGNAAEHIGVCRYQSDCYTTKYKKEGAEGQQAGGIFSGIPTYFTRKTSGSADDSSQNSFGNWSPPSHQASIKINNATLIDAIKNDNSLSVSSSTFRNNIKAGKDASGWVKFFIHRCWAGDPEGCRTSPLYLMVSITGISNPTNFDGKISVSSVSDSTKGSDGVYYTDAATVKANFKYEMKRKDGESSAKETWKAYYNKADKSGITTSTSANKTKTDQTFSNTSWTQVHTHEKSISLNPGQSSTYCEVLAYYKKSDNGSLSDFTSGNSAKQACVTVKRYDDYTFSGSVTPTVTGGTKSGSKWFIDADKISIKFDHKVKRTDSVDANVKDDWKVYYKDGTSGNANASGTVTLGKGKESTVHTHGPSNYDLPNPGEDHTFCETLFYYKTVYHSGSMHESDTKKGCVTIHRYAWYDVTGKVTVSTDATKKGSVYWTDANTASIQFFHKTSTTTTTAIKPKYKTSKSPDPGTTFNVQTNYTQGTAINKNSGEYTQYKSPSGGKASVNVAKDTGTKYCQTMTYYAKVREDSGDYKSATDATGCITLKRYKTTFSGSSEIYVKNDTSKNYNGETITVTGSSYPILVPVTFKHTVKRNAATTDPYDSPNKKRSTITTNIFDGTDTKGYRAGDPHGTTHTTTETEDLAAGESHSFSDTFTVKVYPEQTITLCQQMTYRNEIQGGENVSTANAGKVCVTIKMGRATCLDKEFGIKEAKNYLQAEIYKNSSSAAHKSSGVRYEGSTTITAWAKPGDQIRFNYDACAGGDLAQQYDVNNNKTTTYGVKADPSGYLFGKTLSDSPYTATEKELGKTNDTVGLGPFNKKYTLSVTSPSDGGIYSCDYYPGTSISDFYRIPAYIEGLTPDTYPDSCESTKYGRVSDLGKSFKQTVTWTDTQYTGGSPINGHNGGTAKVEAVVSVPYNYKTKIDTSGQGGYLIPGSDHTEEIKLTVEPRKNNPANGSDSYSTVTKTTKYRLIEIVIGAGYSGSSEHFNNLVNGDKYFSDTNGTREPGTNLTVCKSGFTCKTVVTGGGKRYDPSNNTADGQTLGTYTRKIPYNIEPGVKYCYIAAVWPSDSHNKPSADDLTEADNAAGLTETGTYWHVSGATCFTVAKRPSFAVLGGDTYAQNYISAKVQKYAADDAGTNPRIYGSWGEYAAIAGNELKGFASGATLWGGSNIISNKTDAKQNCAFSAYTFANAKCSTSGQLGKMKISTVTSSNPENIANQIITRYTRTDDTGAMVGDGVHPVAVKDGGICKYDPDENTYSPYDREDGATFECIGDTGAKYTHVKNLNGPVAYVPNDYNYCMGKGDTNSNRTSVIHADGTLVIGTNIAYGNIYQQYWNQPVSPAGLCYEDTYNSISEIPQSIFIAKKIIIKDYVTHIDSWLIADEIITCDPISGWNASVNIKDVNSHNCDKQLTVNGPVMAKDLKLYRTYGTGFEYSSNHQYVTSYQKATPAEYFTMSPEVYLWSFNQAQRYSQATTTYARELAPRY